MAQGVNTAVRDEEIVDLTRLEHRLSSVDQTDTGEIQRALVEGAEKTGLIQENVKNEILAATENVAYFKSVYEMHRSAERGVDWKVAAVRAFKQLYGQYFEIVTVPQTANAQVNEALDVIFGEAEEGKGAVLRKEMAKLVEEMGVNWPSPGIRPGSGTNLIKSLLEALKERKKEAQAEVAKLEAEKTNFLNNAPQVMYNGAALRSAENALESTDTVIALIQKLLDEANALGAQAETFQQAATTLIALARRIESGGKLEDSELGRVGVDVRGRNRLTNELGALEKGFGSVSLLGHLDLSLDELLQMIEADALTLVRNWFDVANDEQNPVAQQLAQKIATSVFSADADLASLNEKVNANNVLTKDAKLEISEFLRLCEIKSSDFRLAGADTAALDTARSDYYTKAEALKRINNAIEANGSGEAALRSALDALIMKAKDLTADADLFAESTDPLATWEQAYRDADDFTLFLKERGNEFYEFFEGLFARAGEKAKVEIDRVKAQLVAADNQKLVDEERLEKAKAANVTAKAEADRILQEHLVEEAQFDVRIGDAQAKVKALDDESPVLQLWRDAGYYVQVGANGRVTLRGFGLDQLTNESARKRIVETLKKAAAFFADLDSNIAPVSGLAGDLQAMLGRQSLVSNSQAVSADGITIDTVRPLVELAARAESQSRDLHSSYFDEAAILRLKLPPDKVAAKKAEHKAENERKTELRTKLLAIEREAKEMAQAGVKMYEALSKVFDKMALAQKVGLEANLPADFEALKVKLGELGKKKAVFNMQDLGELAEVYMGVAEFFENDAKPFALATAFEGVAKEIGELAGPESEKGQVKIIQAMLQREHTDWTAEQALSAAKKRVKLQNIVDGSNKSAGEVVAEMNATKVEAMSNAAFAKLAERMKVSSMGGMVPLKALVGDLKTLIEEDSLRALLQTPTLDLAAWAALYEAFRICAGGALPKQCYIIREGMRDTILKDVEKMTMNGAEKVKRANMAVDALIEGQRANQKMERFMRDYQENEVNAERERQVALLENRIKIYDLNAPDVSSRRARKLEFQALTKDIDKEVVAQFEAEGKMPKAFIGRDWIVKRKVKAAGDAEGLAIATADMSARLASRATFGLWNFMAKKTFGSFLFQNRVMKALRVNKVADLTSKVVTWQPSVVRNWTKGAVKDVYKGHLEAAHKRADYTAVKEDLASTVTDLSKKTEEMSFEVPANQVNIVEKFFRNELEEEKAAA